MFHPVHQLFASSNVKDWTVRGLRGTHPNGVAMMPIFVPNLLEVSFRVWPNARDCKSYQTMVALRWEEASPTFAQAFHKLQAAFDLPAIVQITKILEYLLVEQGFFGDWSFHARSGTFLCLETYQSQSINPDILTLVQPLQTLLIPSTGPQGLTCHQGGLTLSLPASQHERLAILTGPRPF